jgi:hypothetical protein
MKKLQAVFVAMFACASSSAFCQNQFISEAPGSIRFEQYTGATGSVVFWRMPTPGASLFPGGNCYNLSIPADKPEQSSRFMALYLFAKTNSKQIFYVYNPSCTIVSFGMDG